MDARPRCGIAMLRTSPPITMKNVGYNYRYRSPFTIEPPLQHARPYKNSLENLGVLLL